MAGRARRLTDLKVVLVGERVAGRLDLWNSLEYQLAHFVHGILHRRTLILRECLHGNVSSILPRLVELGNASLNCRRVGELLPRPAAVDIRRQDTIPCLRERSELVADIAMEGGPCALQHRQPNNGTLDTDAIPPGDNFDISRLLSIAVEAMGMGLPVYGHARPAMDGDLDTRRVYVRVGIEEMLAKDASIQLWRVYRVLLGLDVDGVLDRVRGNDNAVVGACVSVTSCQPDLTHPARGISPPALIAYDVSMAPSRRQQTVISVTV